MEIWRMEHDFKEYEGFQLVSVDRQFREEFRKKIVGGKRLNGELDNNIEVEVIDGKVPCDFPKFWTVGGGGFVFSQRAKECLENVINDYTEFIPIHVKDKPYYIVNLLSIIDAIDYEKSTFRSIASGLVVGLDKYAFLKDKIKGINMFKVMLYDTLYSEEVFVSSKVKEIIEENKLLGVKFIKVWDSER